MKLLTRLRLFGEKTTEKLMPVDNITQLEDLLKKQSKTLEETKQNYYNSKGKEDYYKTEIKSNKELKEKAIERAKDAKGHKNEEQLKNCFEIQKMAQTKINMYTDCLEKQKNITTKLNTFMTNLETKNSELRCKIELLKTKDEFVKSVEDFKVVQNGTSDINLDDVVKDIEINFNSKSYELDDMNVPELQNSEYEDFVEGL